MRSTLIWGMFMLLCGTYTHAQTPIFNACQAQINDPQKAEECSEEALKEFTAKACRFISREIGFYSNETLTVKIKVNAEGNLKVKQIDSRYTTLLEDPVEKWVELLEGKILPNGGQEKFLLKFNFTVPSTDEVDIYDTDNLPTQQACQDFNGAGKRSCLADVITGTLDNLERRKMQAYSRVEAVLTHNGQFVGVRILSPVTKAMRKVNDSLALRLSRLRRVHLVNPSPYSNTNIKFTYEYDHFFDSPVRRQFMRDIAPSFLAQGDTATFIRKLYRAANDFHRYKHFNEYLREVLHNNDIVLDDYFRISKQNGFLELDSLKDNNYYFDERTSARLGNDFILPIFEGCGMTDTTDYSCTLEHFSAKVESYLHEKYDVDLSHEKYSNPAGPATEYSLAYRVAQVELGTEHGFYIFKLKTDHKGKIVLAQPVLYSHLPMLDELKVAQKNGASNEELLEIVKSQVSYRLIDAISKVDDLDPATLNARECSAEFLFILRTGQRS